MLHHRNIVNLLRDHRGKVALNFSTFASGPLRWERRSAPHPTPVFETEAKKDFGDSD